MVGDEGGFSCIAIWLRLEVSAPLTLVTTITMMAPGGARRAIASTTSVCQLSSNAIAALVSSTRLRTEKRLRRHFR